MTNLKLAFRRLFKAPFVTSVAILSLALGIGANAAIFSLFNQMLLRPLPVPAPHELVNLQAPGPKPGSQSCNQAGNCENVFSYAMFRDLQKAHDGLHRHRRARPVRGEPRLSQPDVERPGRAGLRQLLPGPRPHAGDRPAALAPGRSEGRRIAGRRAQPRLLDDPVRPQSRRARRHADRQRPAPHHRRRRSRGLRRHDARRQAAGLRADHAARPDESRLQPVPQPPQLLGLSVRAAAAGRHASSRRERS